MERTGFAFYGDVKRRRRMIAGGARARSERAHRVREAACPYRRLAYPSTIPALGDRARRRVDRAVELLLRQFRSLRPHVGHGLKAEQQPVETLQQGVVQLPRNAGASLTRASSAISNR